MSGPRPAVTDRPAPVGWRGGPLLPAPAGVAGDSAPGRLLVVKVGGSLLSRPGWPALVGGLLSAQPGRPLCVVVGGGAVVDGLRLFDRAAPADAQLMHTLAIDAMRLTARLVAARIGLPLSAAPVGSGGCAVLDVPAWLAGEPRAAELPVGWEVTSDSIAALVALVHGGGLLLAKSLPPPCPPRLEKGLRPLAEAGWVDDYFPTAAASLHEIAWAAPA